MAKPKAKSKPEKPFALEYVKGGKMLQSRHRTLDEAFMSAYLHHTHKTGFPRRIFDGEEVHYRRAMREYWIEHNFGVEETK